MQIGSSPGPRALAPALVLALVLGAVATAAGSERITIYRCTDAQGRVTLRDTPCKPGQRQDARAMQRPEDPPVRPRPEERPAPPPPPPAEADTRTRLVVATPPRPLYECVTPDGERYVSDTPEGNPRWVPIWTLGYSPLLPRNPLGDRVGAPLARAPHDHPGPPRLPPAIGLALTPGAWVRDHCHPLPQEEVCARLADQHRELDRRWFNAQQTERDRIRAEQRSLQARRRNDCPP